MRTTSTIPIAVLVVGFGTAFRSATEVAITMTSSTIAMTRVRFLIQAIDHPRQGALVGWLA
jgi:hypothetical protein